MGGDPVPGICEGLTQGIVGMTVGSRRRIVVPPEQVGAARCRHQRTALLLKYPHRSRVEWPVNHVLSSLLQGFGSAAVGAPYAFVPPNSTLTYDLELLRLSNIGPDALTRVRSSSETPACCSFTPCRASFVEAPWLLQALARKERPRM